MIDYDYEDFMKLCHRQASTSTDFLKALFMTWQSRHMQFHQPSRPWGGVSRLMDVQALSGCEQTPRSFINKPRSSGTPSPCSKINIRSISTISNPGTRRRFNSHVLDAKISFHKHKDQGQDLILRSVQDQDNPRSRLGQTTQGLIPITYKDHKRFDPCN